MCGGGTILIEGHADWPNAWYLGADIDGERLLLAQDNFKRAGLGHIGLVRWDVTNLPLKDDSVNVVISDIPYGKRHGSVQDNRKLYPAMLKVQLDRLGNEFPLIHIVHRNWLG